MNRVRLRKENECAESSSEEESKNEAVSEMDFFKPRRRRKLRGLFSSFNKKKRNSIRGEGIYRRASEGAPSISMRRSSAANFRRFSGKDEESSENEDIPGYMIIPTKKFEKPVNPEQLAPSEEEWQMYFTWLKEIVFLSPEEGLDQPTLRLSIFLFFLRIGIPLEEITNSHINTEREWLRNRRDVANSIVQYLAIPLDGKYSSSWWCTSNNHPENLKEERFQYVCHFRHTFKLSQKLTKKQLHNQEKFSLTQALLGKEPIPILTSTDPDDAPYQQQYVDWVISFVTAKEGKIPKDVQLNSASVLAKLAWPEEKIPGVLDKIWKSNAAQVILRLAKEGRIEIHQSITMEELVMEHVVGQGAVGKVHLAEYKGENVAVKMTTDDNHAFDLSEFRFELALMCILKHPNILPCIGAYCDGPSYFFVSPYQGRGSLRKILDSSIENLSWHRKVYIARQIASGLLCMHRVSVIHRDVKADNILVNYNWSVVVADFGTSRCFGKADKSEKENMIGTKEWMAPEMFEENDYDEKVDVYSFGILLFELFTRRHPYRDMAHWKVVDHVLNGNRPDIIEGEIAYPELEKLMRKCWHASPKKRPSFKNIEATLIRWEEFLQAEAPPKRVLTTSFDGFGGYSPDS